MAATLGNLGVLARHRGVLAEAEAYYKRGLALAEQMNDPVYISLLYSYLATAVQDQGKLNEARVSLHRALKISRAMNSMPCLGFALVALGRLHVAQAQASQEHASDSPGTVKQQSDGAFTRLLKLARTTLQRALRLEGLEAETRTEGQLALAQVSFLLGEIDAAQMQAMQAMEEAGRLEQTWLLPCAWRLMGEIQSTRGRQKEAETYFGQALETLQKCGMRLEWARTLQSYGVARLAERGKDDAHYRQGLSYLQEAYQVCRECNAMLDLRAVSRVLSRYSSSSIASSDMQA
jgi:tetratricopeptide (TPR) repeat protein